MVPEDELRNSAPRQHTASENHHTQWEATLRPSTVPVDELRNSTPRQHTASENHHMQGEREQKVEDIQRQQRARRVRRVRSYLIMDDQQLMIPGNIYQSWLQDTSDIVSRRGRTVSQCLRSANLIRSSKISILMRLPPVALISSLGLLPLQIHYPAPLMELWRKITEENPTNNSPSGDKPPTGKQQGQQASHEFDPEDVRDEIASNTMEFATEMQRANVRYPVMQGINEAFSNDHFPSSGSSAGHSANSISSSGSGHIVIPLEPEILPSVGRPKRKQNSSSKANLGNLDPVEEEFSLRLDARGSKIGRLSDELPTPDLELLQETGPTQTPVAPSSDPLLDKTTQLIRTQLKLHFDTPGVPPHESLNQLALGMNKKRAAQFFYQTCVLATSDFIKVEQHEAYGDISISRGPKL
ncbi:sister chromatid cohesion 1 protein 1 [Canna indica]|uniref:Sister chromatid cohesion 1 protein 1 n=1 Tax=Canna indica TaxID=4628 RepID=A0AAQ3KIB1_9LILI|nr:sister chromatid cohesion 1 protein 1 [Canna indica]